MRPAKARHQSEEKNKRGGEKINYLGVWAGLVARGAVRSAFTARDAHCRSLWERSEEGGPDAQTNEKESTTCLTSRSPQCSLCRESLPLLGVRVGAVSLVKPFTSSRHRQTTASISSESPKQRLPGAKVSQEIEPADPEISSGHEKKT